MCTAPVNLFSFPSFSRPQSTAATGTSKWIARQKKRQLQSRLTSSSRSFCSVKRQEKSILFYCCTVLELELSPGLRGREAIEGLHHGDIFLLFPLVQMSNDESTTLLDARYNKVFLYARSVVENERNFPPFILISLRGQGDCITIGCVALGSLLPFDSMTIVEHIYIYSALVAYS